MRFHIGLALVMTLGKNVTTLHSLTGTNGLWLKGQTLSGSGSDKEHHGSISGIGMGLIIVFKSSSSLMPFLRVFFKNIFLKWAIVFTHID
jgi:hypothetical protein